MGDILKWISKHKKITTLLCCIIIFLPIIIIHVLFKIKTNFYWLQSEWTSGEVLGYFGDVLSFIGTITLGYIAVSQTEKANSLSEELLRIEKDKLKPRLDFSQDNLYNIYLSDNIYQQFSVKKRPERMIMEILYTTEPRSGIVTDSALIELEVLNRSGSDISQIYVRNVDFYLCVNDPNNNSNKKIGMLTGNTNLNIGEKRTLYIYVKREINNISEIDEWYTEHIRDIMPHMEFELILETTSGERYLEKITCGSGWDATMQSENNLAVRELSVWPIEVTKI